MRTVDVSASRAAALLVGWLVVTASGAHAADGPPIPVPPPDRRVPVETLPEVIVEAPRINAGPYVAGPETIESPLRGLGATFDVPYGTSVVTRDDQRERRNARSLPDAMLRLPSTMVQKTGPGQSSPYLRGFTGYHNLLLVDGIRLNNSTLRSGPNQYWSTVDPYTVERLEIARGPHSVLWGSDAVGGVVNVVPRRRESFCPGFHVDGGLFARYASGEDARIARAEVEGNRGDVGFLGGVSWKDYGDIESGGGELPETAFEERDADFRFDIAVSPVSRLSVAWQHVRQYDVPRTHTTIHAVPFHGSGVGTELQRDLDQARDLVYAKYAWDGAGGAFPSGHATVSWQRQEEEQDRRRTGGRRDLSGFDVETWGASVQLDRPTCLGLFTFGADYTHDDVESFRHNFLDGVLQSTDIQGPVGDDGRYDLLGVYAQDRIERGRWEWIVGARFTYAAAEADRVDDPLVPGADPTTPGNVISVDHEWSAVVGSVRAIYHASRRWNVYGGVSQAFRTPSLSDLTAFETTSVVETPSPGLDPDRYTSFEVGTKVESRNVSAAAAVWVTALDDTIVRSPTGVLIEGIPEVRKDNVGDGYLWGLEVEAAWRFRPCWTAFGNLTWMDGKVDQFDPSGRRIDDHSDRLMPFTTLVGLRFEPVPGRFWAQAEWVHADDADRLSQQNATDTQRIPPGGTPGYDVLNLRAGYRLFRETDLLFAIENVTDENYRIHGSGVNEPGISFVLGLDVRF
jgi:hemoglobin/transferrin/lactoferrin receptor protein